MKAIIDSVVQDASSKILTISNLQYIFEMFRTTIYQFMLKNPADTLAAINDYAGDYRDKMILLLEDFFMFIYESCCYKSLVYKSEEHLYVQNLESFGKVVFARFFNFYKKLEVGCDERFKELCNIFKFSISLIQKSEAKSPEEELSCNSDLKGWVLQDFDKNQNLLEKFVTLESSFSSLNPEDREKVLGHLRESDSAVWLQKLQEDELEKLSAIICLRNLLEMLTTSKSWLILKCIIKYCAGACKIFSCENIKFCVKNYFSRMPEDDAFIEKIKEIYSIFMSLKHQPQERLDILEYFFLPALRIHCQKYFELYCKDLLKHISAEVDDENDDVARKQTLITKIGGFKIFEIIFGIISPNVLTSYTNLYTLNDETLISYIKKKAIETNNFSVKRFEEKELARLLHCAVLNCLLALACCENQDYLYDMVFREIDWEKIINTELRYDFSQTPSTFKSVTISLKCTKDEIERMFEALDQKTIQLEEDDLNDHECMGMITGAMMYFFNSDLARKKVYSRQNMPKWLSYFQQEFSPEKTSLNTFFMRIISNLKELFLFYITHFFEPIVTAVHSHLKCNSIDYLVRDMLEIIIEAKLVPKAGEYNLAQSLVEILIDRAADSSPEEIFTYNIELIEKIVSIWRDKITIPTNFEDKCVNSPDLAIRIIPIFFRNEIECENLIASRHVHAVIRRIMFRFLDPLTPLIHETLGYIIKYITEEQRILLVEGDLFRKEDGLYVSVQRYV